MQQTNNPGPIRRNKFSKTVHITLHGVEWEDLAHLAVLADVSRSHIARMALRHVLAHPELVLHSSQELSDGKD
jgi:hypothetical protein